MVFRYLSVIYSTINMLIWIQSNSSLLRSCVKNIHTWACRVFHRQGWCAQARWARWRTGTRRAWRWESRPRASKWPWPNLGRWDRATRWFPSASAARPATFAADKDPLRSPETPKQRKSFKQTANLIRKVLSTLWIYATCALAINCVVWVKEREESLLPDRSFGSTFRFWRVCAACIIYRGWYFVTWQSWTAFSSSPLLVESHISTNDANFSTKQVIFP